jgi:hypothetical protein
VVAEAGSKQLARGNKKKKTTRQQHRAVAAAAVHRPRTTSVEKMTAGRLSRAEVHSANNCTSARDVERRRQQELSLETALQSDTFRAFSCLPALGTSKEPLYRRAGRATHSRVGQTTRSARPHNNTRTASRQSGGSLQALGAGAFQWSSLQHGQHDQHRTSLATNSLPISEHHSLPVPKPSTYFIQNFEQPSPSHCPKAPGKNTLQLPALGATADIGRGRMGPEISIHGKWRHRPWSVAPSDSRMSDVSALG